MAENVNKPDGPAEPLPYAEDIPDLDVIAIQMNETFQALQRGGFAHNDALHIVSFMINSRIDYRFGESYYEEDEFSSEEEEDLELDPDLDEDGDDFV